MVPCHLLKQMLYDYHGGCIAGHFSGKMPCVTSGGRTIIIIIIYQVPPAAFETKEFKMPTINTPVQRFSFQAVSNAGEEEWN